MPKVNCEARRCAHNLGGEVCNADTVTIHSYILMDATKTECTTFIPRGFSSSRVSLENVNYTGLVVQAFNHDHIVNPQVWCHVKSCRYHEEECACSAENILVLHVQSLMSRQTACGHFVE
jgi:hypothetical protein